MAQLSHCQNQPISQNWAIAQLPGIAEEDCTKLRDRQIVTTWQLLQRTKTVAEKRSLAAELHIPERLVSKWVALADLARVPGVDCQYCGMLLHAGIISVAQLTQIPARKLHQQLLRLVVATLQSPDLCPGVEEVSQWIERSRRLVPLVNCPTHKGMGLVTRKQNFLKHPGY